MNIAAYLACHSGIVSAALYQVPNQQGLKGDGKFFPIDQIRVIRDSHDD